MISTNKYTSVTALNKLKEISSRLGIPWPWLWLVIQHESGWKTTAINPISGSVGPIQFMPNTLSAIGASQASVLRMTPNEQLDLVYQYFLPYKKKVKDLDDTYLGVFYPYAIGRPASYVLGSERSPSWAAKVAQQNPANNPDKNQYITVSEIRKVMANLARQYGYTGLDNFADKLKRLF